MLILLFCAKIYPLHINEREDIVLNWELFVLILYFVAMLAIGVVFFFRSKSKTDKDYFLGGKSMGPWVTALSAQASDMSAWLLMGLPGSILAFGFGEVWIGIGLAIGTALNWILVAHRLRKFSQAANDSITLPQYLSNRFATKSKGLQVTCAIVFLICFTFYVASAFVAGTKVFVSLFPSLDPMLAMVIFASILIVYTFLGGFSAVCWTDFFQGLLMLVAVLAVPIIIVISGEMVPELLGETVYEVAKDGSISEHVFVGSFFEASVKDIFNGLAWGLGYFGMPHILVRFMAIKKASLVKKSATVAITWVVLALAAVVCIATFGRMLPGVGAELLQNGKDDMIFVELARKLFPPAITGFLLAAIIAASMSTADSQLLVASSSFTSDIYKPLIRKKASNKEVLWVGRAVVLFVAAVAFMIALDAYGDANNPIMALVDAAWAGFGSAFGSVVLLSLFWRRFTYKGALAGVITGALVDIVWQLFLSDLTGVYELIPGFAASMIIAIAVTLLDKEPSKEVTDIYDAAISSKDE